MAITWNAHRRVEYLHLQNRSVYDPHPKNPKGEIHEDWGMISYDKSRKHFFFRQFHVDEETEIGFSEIRS